LIDLEVILHGLDAADLGADSSASQLLGNPVMDEPLAQRHYLDVGDTRSPDLPLGQWPLVITLHIAKSDASSEDYVHTKPITFL
jgi:hypothetical protein